MWICSVGSNGVILSPDEVTDDRFGFIMVEIRARATDFVVETSVVVADSQGHLTTESVLKGFKFDATVKIELVSLAILSESCPDLSQISLILVTHELDLDVVSIHGIDNSRGAHSIDHFTFIVIALENSVPALTVDTLSEAI